MAIGYPPQPVFPNGIDSDYTLFLVYNTSEAVIVEDNEPWAEEIVIKPRTKNQNEIWADNGFANINGELLYYDAVEKDSNGKVYKLKRCARNLGGNPTQFNTAGNMVRGFVVAEHHNQLVDAIILTEKFIGYDLTDDESTLDWRIRQLEEVPIITDDFGCPDVTFYFTVVSSDPSSGTIIDYRIDITGSYNQFSLNFGDGSTTSSTQSGTHTYAPNAKIDPVVIFKSQNCEVIQTPSERDSVDFPQSEIIPTSYSIPNPPNFVFPNINIQSPSIPEPNMQLPPFQFPYIDIAALNIPAAILPSIIMFQPAINLPSTIDFSDVNIPSFINFGSLTIPSTLSLTVPTININVPNISLVVPNISVPSLNVPAFPSISIATPTFPNIGIHFGSVPTVPIGWTPVPAVDINWGSSPQVSMAWGSPPNAGMNWGTPPTLTVDWGSPPTINVTVTLACPSTPLALAAADTLGITNDMLGIGKDLEVQYDVSGFPSEIKIIPPEIPDIRLIHDIPSEVLVKFPSMPELKFDTSGFRDFKILLPETPLTIETIGIPKVIQLESAFNIPSTIELFTSVNIPEKIMIEHDIPSTIRVEGLPDVIRLEHNLPSSIKLEMPDKPEIDLVYKGSGIPVKIELDIQKLISDQDNLQCVAIVPCRKN